MTEKLNIILTFYNEFLEKLFFPFYNRSSLGKFIFGTVSSGFLNSFLNTVLNSIVFMHTIFVVIEYSCACYRMQLHIHSTPSVKFSEHRKCLVWFHLQCYCLLFVHKNSSNVIQNFICPTLLTVVHWFVCRCFSFWCCCFG